MDDVKNAIAVIRPPGHHAEQHEASGFCIFNNVSIAAKVTQNSFSDRIRRILILDWDVHHGNGIQNAFYDNANVLYISIHVYKNGLFYPNGPGGDHLHCGVGKGEGKNVNIPWADNGMGDNDYLYAFDEVVIPIAFEFDPDLVIVAAGFDAAEGDELGGCHVSPAGYAHMTHKLMGLANGRLVVCLEGGYDLKAISKSALAVTKTLMGEPPDRIPGYSDNDPDAKASRLGVATVSMVKRHQAAYWHCMHPKKEDLPRLTAQSVQMHSLISDWRSMLFSKEYGLEPMVIDRNFLSRSFENNVLAT
jgi:histone deacetylase 6